jgi:hypothetical protein
VLVLCIDEAHELTLQSLCCKRLDVYLCGEPFSFTDLGGLLGAVKYMLFMILVYYIGVFVLIPLRKVCLGPASPEKK